MSFHNRQEAQPCAFQFNYQLDKNLQPATLRVGRTKPDGLFYTNPDLDVTVVEILDAPTDVTPVTLARQKVQKDNRVNIIQHPVGITRKSPCRTILWPLPTPASSSI
ncbi:MAG: trypsin-like peptidase domain-containing protein [Chloroflexi bacterium]|nr:trypsin-like peptidase domain-containing protein [Chloroflexota bacterium]